MKYKVVLALVIIVVNLSCNFGINYEKFIIGTWVNEGEISTEYTFNNEGTYFFKYDDGSNEQGYWEFNRSELVLTGNGGDVIKWRIKSLTNKRLEGEIFVDFNFKVPYTMIKVK